MSQEIVRFDVNNALSLANLNDVKEEFQDEYYVDNKMCVSETTITDNINITNTEINEYIKDDRLRKYETLSVNHIKSDLLLSEVNDTVSNHFKIENGICAVDTQIGFCNELPFCNHCHEVYQDYCTKCRMLIHILNKRHSRTACNRIRELPKYVLEARESMGHLGIFSLMVIPENVRFGPFTGLNTEPTLRIRGGRFVVSHDKLEHLNWMQYVNPAGNIYEQNLLPFQYENKLYYCSTRRIQEGEELLVYFGAEYEDNLLKNVEMDFIPIGKKNVENVFGCILCCLGFSSKEYLAEHKAVSHSGTDEMFCIEVELTQCPFCKIYLEAKEYFELHMDYCCETNDRYCGLTTPEVHKLEIDRRSSPRSKAKRRKRGIYKCMQCKFTTMYNADFRLHINKHYEVKIYKCRICHRKYTTKKSLRVHVEKIHVGNEGRGIQKCTTFDYFKANIKERSPHLRDGEKQRQSSKYMFQTMDKRHLKSRTRIKRLNRGKYKCADCEFKTYCRTYLERHMKIKHFKENYSKCVECEFKTNYKSSLNNHVKAKHLKDNNYICEHCGYKTSYKASLKEHITGKHLKQHYYKCTVCEYKTNHKTSFNKHVSAKHLKEFNYECEHCGFETNYKSSLKKHATGKHPKQVYHKCTECEYQTNFKSYLKEHITVKHLKQKKQYGYKTNYKSKLKQDYYKCTECEFKTNHKSSLNKHVSVKHLKENNYKCDECGLKTNYKSVLERHIKAKHLNQLDYYKCTECEFKTNYQSSLNEHVNAKHLKEKNYKCEQCGYKTNYKSNLPKHVRGKHLKQDYYKCTECEYKTNYKSSLNSHVNAKHLKEKNYKCEQCGYKTNYKSNLKRHVTGKHQNQDYYKCPV